MGAYGPWGENYYGQIGNGISGEDITDPVKVIDGGVVSVSVARSKSFAVKEDGSLWGWGIWGYGYRERPAVIGDTPTKIMDNVSSAYAVLGEGLYVIKTDGTLCFLNIDADDKILTVELLEDVVSFSASNTHLLAVKSDYSLWGGRR